MSVENLSCFHKHERDFLVSVTVHKARNLDVLNADTFVVVNFDGDTKKTKTFRNSDCPFFNEYFVFELRISLEELLKKSIRLSLVQTSLLKKNSIIGELIVNLATVWRQNYHAFVKKWGVLEKFGDNRKTTSSGYLQVDLSIISTTDPPAPAILQSFDDDIIEKNMLLPDAADKSKLQNVKYIVNIFDGTFIVKRDYILQVSFGSYHTRTRQIKNSKHCKWNEQMIFRGKFQSFNQIMVFELLVHDFPQWKIKCAVELNFSEMCWKIDGIYNKPEFGPSFLSFYEGTQRNLYCGKCLVSITTENVDEKVKSLMNLKQDILLPLNETDFWDYEIFRINMILLSADAITMQPNSIKIYLTCEGIFSNEIDLDVREYDDKMKIKFVHFSSSMRPLMSFNIRLPDTRLKNQMRNLMKMVIDEMESNIKNYKQFEAKYYDNVAYQNKCLKMFFQDLKFNIENLSGKLFYKTFKRPTKWDENYLKFIEHRTHIFIEQIDETLNHLKLDSDTKKIFQMYLNICDSLIEAQNDTQSSMPYIFLNIAKDNKLIAFHRFYMNEYYHSQSNDAQSQHCGKVQTIYIKPITCLHTCHHCGCLFGKFETLMWIGSDKEVNEWLPQNTIVMTSNKVNFTIEQYFRCNVYVHQAKIQPGLDKSGLCDSKVVITISGMHDKTKVVNRSLSAVWNEVLVLDNIKLFDIGIDKRNNFPAIALFLFDEDKRKWDLVGTGCINVPLKFITETNKIPSGKNVALSIVNNRIADKIDIRTIFDQFVHQFPPPLRWIKFFKDGKLTAEVLMSAEFVQLPVPTLNVRVMEKNEQIPVEIRPDMKKFRLEITFAGIRNAQNLVLFSSGRYKIEVTIGELSLISGFSGKSYDTNLNFLDPYASGYLLLPEQFQFWPPIIIKHLDCSNSKHPKVLGAAMIRRPEKFFIEEKSKGIQRFLLHQKIDDDTQKAETRIDIAETEPLLGISNINERKKTIQHTVNNLKFLKFLQVSNMGNPNDGMSLEHQYTWWTKFHNSNREPQYRNEAIHQLHIFNSELEKQNAFEYLNDWASPIDLYHRKSHKNRSYGNKYATVKCSIKLSKCSGKEFFESDEKTSTNVQFRRISNLVCEIPILVRIYVIQGINLRSRDIFSYSDAFIKIDYGGQTISDRAHYVPNQTSPIFGKRFQMSGIIPKNNLLKVSVFDRDSLLSNDLIGTTIIDLEDRVRSKYGATCGIAKEYNAIGYNTWRNSMLPSQILHKLCNDMELLPPQYTLDKVILAGIEFKDTSEITKDGNIKERLALSVLNNFERVDGVGHKLVPEHVETRSLYRDDRPGVEQGKLMLWIELFDPRKSIPEPVDITPIPPRPYELRVIIWNVHDVILDEKNIFGKSMSDIYVKGWLDNIDDSQYTDIHYRSLTGEGNFNWRMIFPLKYSIGEDVMVISKKKHSFEKYNTEFKMPAILNLQVWDNDSFSPDDFLGTLTINLSNFQKPFKSQDKCSIVKKVTRSENLFATDSTIRGWLPVYGKAESDGAIEQTGKLELELQVLSEEKARDDPAGLGREAPHPLPHPDRPDTSFNWLSNPIKSVTNIFWPGINKLKIAIFILVISAIVILVAMKLPQRIFNILIGL